MPGAQEPETGLLFYELSHVWGHGVPTLPGYEDVKIFRSTTHAKNGVMAQRIRTIMHTGTHMNAPRHIVQQGIGVGEIALDRCFGPGVVVSIPKTEWQQVTATDLEAASPTIEAGDIVVIVTGWHRKYSDSIEYFGHSPGLSKDAAEWLVARDVKLVAVDTPQVDHPLATSLGNHRNGPQMKRIPNAYEASTGRSAAEDFPIWNVAHHILLEAGIPTIENVGGDVADLAGKACVFQAYPWNWHEGDACPVRLVGILDPEGKYRIEAGKAA
jgi:kynurenine formamidase